MTTDESLASSQKEIGLIDILGILAAEWRKIVLVTVVAIIISLSLAFLLPEKFTATITILPVNADGTSGSDSQLGGLASLAGVDISSGGSRKYEYLAILESREFIYEFFDKFKALAFLYPKDWDDTAKSWKSEDSTHTNWKSYNDFMDNNFSINEDIATGIVTLSIETSDAATSAAWANALVEDVNLKIQTLAQLETAENLRYLEQQSREVKIESVRLAIFNAIENEIQNAMMANVRKEYAFKVLDPAVEPEMKSAPKRAVIMITGTTIGLFIGAFWVLLIGSFRANDQKAPRH